MKTRYRFLLVIVFFSAVLCAQPVPPASSNPAPVPALPLLAVGGLVVLYKRHIYAKS